MCEPHWFLILSVVALVVFLVGYRSLTKPAIAIPFGVFCIAFFLISCLDPNFMKIVAKADNVPIVIMMFAVGFPTWLA